MPPTVLPLSPKPTRLLALGCVVAGLHGLLLEMLAARRPPAAAVRPVAALLLVPRPAVAPQRAAMPKAAVVPQPVTARAAAAAVARLSPPQPLADADRPAGRPSTEPAADDAVTAPEPAGPAGAAAQAPPPPPQYPTRLPTPTRQLFAAQVNGVAAEAELDWQHDGQRYRLDLTVRGASRGLVEQRSEGGFDAAGVAPERFVDRRRGRLVGAAHFRRDIGRITFSGPSVDYPAWPGSQDRLAWLPQIAAVLAAADSPPAELRFFVADARGIARAWDFRSEGHETVETDSGPVQALKYVRDPQRPDDLRIGVWLDPAVGWWPVRIDFVVPIGGARLTLVRRSIEAPLPLPSAPGS